ncbi:MAG TPA: cytochrome P450, partial [Alphaproteobacteria bacterium]|nr:cytochrome P450 [Alphaproteobacteria bacterium]
MLDQPPIQPIFEKEYKGLRLLKTIRKDPLGYFLNLGVQNGSYTWLSLLGSPVLFLNDATAIEYVFRHNDKNYHKGKYNEGLRPLLGYGVFLSEDALWRQQRRDTAPVFSGSNFPEFTTRINEAVDAMLERWQPHAATGKPIDMNAET